MEPFTILGTIAMLWLVLSPLGVPLVMEAILPPENRQNASSNDIEKAECHRTGSIESCHDYFPPGEEE